MILFFYFYRGGFLLADLISAGKINVTSAHANKDNRYLENSWELGTTREGERSGFHSAEAKRNLSRRYPIGIFPAKFRCYFNAQIRSN